MPELAPCWLVTAWLLFCVPCLPCAAVEPAGGAGPPEAGAQPQADVLASLRISTGPADAHVYARGPAPGATFRDLAGQCTGSCTLPLAPGTYRLEAGLSHANLSVVPVPVTLGRGEVLALRIDVRRNEVQHGIMLGGLGTTLACLVAYLAVGAADWPNFPEGMARATPVTNGLLAGVAAGFVVATVAYGVMDDPIVTIRR